VGQTGAVQVVEGLGQWGQEGYQLTVTESGAAREEGFEAAGYGVLGDEDPGLAGLAVLEQAGEVGMAEALKDLQVVAEAVRVGEGVDGQVFEHGVPPGGAVPDQPGGPGRPRPEHPSKAVTGRVGRVEFHAQEDAPIAITPAEVIHSLPPGARKPPPTLEDVSAIKYVEAGFGDAAVEYGAAWEEQRRLHGEVVAGTGEDTVVLLEHPPVYTAGKRTEPHERPLDGTPVVDVDRGGKITWHGPGQLVGYPIVRLASHVYVVDYVRRLEEALIAVCSELGVQTGRVKGRSGVWVAADDRGRERKIAAIGIRVAQGVTMHGFALNCDNDLAWFDRIVPCGIADADVTTLSKELGRDVPVTEVLEPVRRHLDRLLSWEDYERSPDIQHEEEQPSGITYGLTV
jgi:lipoyl(octanoyl) transferase